MKRMSLSAAALRHARACGWLSGMIACSGFAVASATAAQTAADAASDEAEAEAAVPLAGHSAHGAAYNEGPRQNAYLMGGTGDVHFPISSASEQAQLFFNQGVGQLHGFWYYEAERSFRRVRSLDPDSAMARWGMAMANIDNPKRARKLIAEALTLKGAASRREQMYLDALDTRLGKEDDDGNVKPSDKERRQAYVKALEKIIREYPEDLEAKALLAVHLWQSNRRGLPITSYAAVDALLQTIFQANPMHPAHHYRIHLWDHEDPAAALASAARCGQASPSIAHMWHMPGHIYSRLKRYDDAAWQQEASARADHAHMMRDLVLPDQIHNYAHNNEWLISNLIFLGRCEDALALAKNMLEVPRHPKYNSFAQSGMNSCKYGRQRLFTVLETFELWDETVALADTMYLEPTDQLVEQARRLRLLGIARHHRGDWNEFVQCRRELSAIDDLVEEKATAAAQKAAAAVQEKAQGEDSGAAADQVDADKLEKAKTAAAEKVRRQHKAVAAAIQELEGLHLLAKGDQEAALEAFASCGDLPAMRKANYAFRCGDHAKAIQIASEAVGDRENQVPPLAVQIELLRRAGKSEAAQEAFSVLRGLAAHADLNAPPLARLAKLAEAQGWPQDWRLPQTTRDDTGQRPELGSLGPFRWAPSPAESWTLPDGNQTAVSLADYSGRPVIVIFYLGFGCLHCVEQLQTFAPRTQDFRDAGIEMVAISTDGLEDLATSIKNFSDEETFPIRLVSDAELNVFRSYRCYDDFEETPLHGTFLIDGKGFIRWQDISYEPFEDPEFLLREAQRLLSLPVE